MADARTENDSAQREGEHDQTLLVAHVTVHLLSGESFELYPFVDNNDVKSKVSDLVEGWAKSGFLLRGPRMYPWHQVHLLETTSVEEITHAEAHQRLMAWEAADQARAIASFWKTKQAKKGEDGKKDDEGEGGKKGGH